jgi:hypothetical protein
MLLKRQIMLEHAHIPKVIESNLSSPSYHMAELRAGVFAEYRTDYQGPIPHAGWKYLWNAPTDWVSTNQVPTPKSQNGSLGNIGETNCYFHLDWTGRWNVDTNQSSNNDSSPGRYLYLDGTSGHPGRGSSQADTFAADSTATQPLPPTGPNTLNRYPIAAYTIQPGETGPVFIVNSWLYLNNGGRGSGNTLVVRVYVNSRFKYQVKQTGIVNRTITFDGVLGTLGTNDTVYVAVGPDGDDGSDGFNWNFCLSNVPDSTNGNIRAADFKDDYLAGTNIGDLAILGNGWSYLWNAPSDWNGTSSSNGLTGPIDNAADYELLKWSGTKWSPDGDDNSLNGAPGNYMGMTSTSGHPGRGYSQKEGISNDFDRYVISAFQAEASGYYVLHDSWFSTYGSEANGNEVRVYTSNSPSNPVVSVVFMAVANATFNTKLGYLNAGDIIYVAVGPSVTDGGDNYGIDYSISIERRAIEWPESRITELGGTSVKAAVVLSSPNNIVTNAAVTLYWKTAGESDWTVTNSLGNVATGTLENVTLTNLARDTTYYYAFYGSNALTNAAAWSPTNSFTTFDLKDYIFRQRITFSGYTGNETLTNFPALVILNEGQKRFFHHELASGTGADLKFINSNLTAVLNHEVELWDTNAASYVWVQVSQLTTNTSIWAYWGNTNISVAPVYTTNGTTWSAKYAGVWHFLQTGGLEDLGDSVVRGLSGIQINDPVSVSGKIGYGVDFNGTNDGFYVNSTNLRATGINFAEATVSWWVLTDFMQMTLDDWWELSVPTGEYVAEFPAGASCDLFDVNSDISGARDVPGNAFDLRGSWHFLTATMNKPENKVRLYIDGVLQASNTWTAAAAIENFSVGYALQRAGNNIDATIDELRLSTVARSADWINASYVNQGANGTFCTYEMVDPFGWTHGTIIMIK